MTAIKPSPSKTGAARRSWSVLRIRTLPACVLALACAWSGAAAASADAAGTARHIGATQQLAALLYGHSAYRSPRAGAPLIASVPSRAPITGERTTLPVVGQASGSDGSHWLKVMLPGRPNGSTGWIARAGTYEIITGWHIVVRTARRRMWVYFHGRVERTIQAVVGKPATPTPSGNFFVEETVIVPASEAGGPFALALSSRSDVLQEFNGGPGQIAIHGRDGLGGVLGTAASHGCIRLSTTAITWLAARIVPGVPVTVYR